MTEPTPSAVWANLDLRSAGVRLFRGAVRLVGALLMAGLLVMHRPWPVDLRVLGGVAALGLVALLFLRFHLRHTALAASKVAIAEPAVWATSLLAVLGVQAANLALGPQIEPRAMFLLTAPLVAQAMLVSALFGPPVSLVSLAVTSLLLGFAGALPIDIVAAAWVAGAVGAHAVSPMKQRSDLLRALGVQIVAQAVLAACLVAVGTSQPRVVAEAALWSGFAAVIATSVFWIGVALVERAFGIVSDWSLVEICSPEHPLLRELVLRAPGTHVHSIGVAHLAESAAREIGASPVLCRAMAYFHDVGKLARPSYFHENQRGENAHDRLAPTLSAEIIAAHVKDGVELARRHRLPQDVVDGIQQHHGTSLISYFYNRAVRQAPDSDNDELEQRFRYEGPRPQSREAAILHLADQVEAVGRATPRDADLAEIVHRIVEGSRADGQLDESDLTFRELRTIERSFVKTLEALRHERVAYPAQEAEAESPDHGVQRNPQATQA